MSTPERKPTESFQIPSRRVIINDDSQLPIDYSSTPGGTIFSTTPGGTRIVYDRAFLMQLRNSPVARTPPKNLPNIPGVTTPLKKEKANGPQIETGAGEKTENHEEPQFSMDV